MTDKNWIEDYRKGIDAEGYVEFNKDRRLGQNQYASRNVDGRHGANNLGEGLRWKFREGSDASDYHDIRIHIDDLEEFHRRYRKDQDRVLNGR